MEKTIKCLLLKNQKWLVTQIEEIEVEYELNMPNCKLTKPYVITEEKLTGSIHLVPWCKFTNDDEMMIFSEYIVTIVDPKGTILDEYLKITE